MLIHGKPLFMKDAPKNSQLNMLNYFCRDLASGMCRAFGELQRSQVKPEKALERLKTIENSITAMVQEDFGKAKFPVVRLGDKIPDLTEEYDNAYWLFEPVAGRLNMLHGREPFGFQMAFIRNEEPVAAAVYNPISDIIYTAAKDFGAKGEYRFRVANRITPEDALLLLPQQTKDLLKTNLIEKLLPTGAHTRKNGFNSKDILEVCAGTADGVFMTHATPLDAAIAMIFIPEAGGYLSDWRGQKVTIKTEHIIAANPKMHGALLKLLAGR